MDQSDVNTKLKHKEWRKIAKKFRRKRLRQAFAKARDEEQEKLQSLLEKDPKYIVWQTEQKALELFKKQEEERIRDEEHKKWLENELEAQKKWKESQEKLKAARELKEKQQQLIKKEWEEQQKKIEEERERKAKIQKEQEERYRILMQKIEDFIKDGGKIPDELKTPKDTNPSKPLCPFFTKIGACRFGDSCSRNHQSPGISKVLLLRNFYTHFGIEKCFQSEYGNDMALEYDDKETYEHFKEFFFDTIAEFKKSGRVVQYKVCCNTEPHLRGNVYVEYERTRDALKAYRQFQGRWYGGKQLNVEFSGVSSWKKAICGMLAVQNISAFTIRY
ncbi:U2 small nuclear ribonucleoprotein auxiliary factor 35 kDa subunit-related protein 2-like [Ctenocephalides felis]|uniref:U2 small nuclear ribonucleoprotein auxiliary factor 35 kDa subunit-related protein 2-like n=1 Tax=Ctenocephalides felis TaxID=7515 RepID=UPI000E6E2836|nr:U2 small nuclear ribonucleoprotein auxiliary factor 35 kDa subunit-related protein 2-like [Ctenocephalides felis]XP_026481062.1 U2 small nuclear ribonucleoprotein auxiliary factor 35 kDa subunit-related protein 2-like [Ctenocephalides felis]